MTRSRLGLNNRRQLSQQDRSTTSSDWGLTSGSSLVPSVDFVKDYDSSDSDDESESDDNNSFRRCSIRVGRTVTHSGDVLKRGASDSGDSPLIKVGKLLGEGAFGSAYVASRLTTGSSGGTSSDSNDGDESVGDG